MTKQCQHFLPEECEIIISLLRIYEDIFDGKLGMWNSKPVDFELKDYAKPVFPHIYPVTKANKEVFIKEVNQLVRICCF